MNASASNCRDSTLSRRAPIRRSPPALLVAMLASLTALSSGCGPDRKVGRYPARDWRDAPRGDRKDGRRTADAEDGQFALLGRTNIGAEQPLWPISPLTVIETHEHIRLLNRWTEQNNVCEVHILMGPNPGSNRPAQAWFDRPRSLPPLILGDGWYVFKFDNTTGRPWRLAASRRVVAAGCGTTVLFQVSEDYHRVALLDGQGCEIVLTSEIVPVGQPGHTQRLRNVSEFSQAGADGVLSAPALTTTNAQFDAFVTNTVQPELARAGL